MTATGLLDLLHAAALWPMHPNKQAMHVHLLPSQQPATSTADAKGGSKSNAGNIYELNDPGRPCASKEAQAGSPLPETDCCWIQYVAAPVLVAPRYRRRLCHPTIHAVPTGLQRANQNLPVQ